MLADRFLLFIKNNKLFDPKDRILLAVSGGMDSVVMAELFHRAQFKFAIAHCNFQLRGKESEGDEKFATGLAKKYGVKFYSKRFNTEEQAIRSRASIQMAARELRYAWFDEIIRKEKYKYIATAHHLNDSIETFLINLLRGTGIEGMTGIKAKNANIIRPLLFATRNEIEKFAKENKISYREDSSNLTDDYLRNKIRHHLTPVLKDLNPQFDQIMSGNLSRLAFAENIVSDYLKNQSQKLLKTGEKFTSITIAEFKKQEYPAQVLFGVIGKLGFSFSQCEEMLNESSGTPTGKMFTAEKHRILRDRGKLILSSNAKEYQDDHIVLEETKLLSTNFGELKMSFAAKTGKSRLPDSNKIQCVDAGMLKFPLTMRRWKAGDYFFPLGMKHSKKLSDFFVDGKVNLFDKENMYVLTSENKIVCILGLRIDDRFKVTDKTKKIYKVEMKHSLL